MTRGVARAFAAARRERRGAFLPYLPCGYPDPAESDRLLAALCEEGADVVELGVPFSDPVADGPTIQRATEIALAQGTTLGHVLGQALRIRARHATPIVLMSYLNPIVRHGVDRFAAEAADAGVDGVIVVDLPPEEDPAIWETLAAAELDTIALVTPTTDPRRLPAIAARARGFLYVVARLGVTGKGADDPELPALLDRCREVSPLPRCLGFGLGPASDLARFRGRAEGAIVGSSLIEAIGAAPDPASRERAARDFARRFRERLAAIAPA
ncbi:MAG: tryptophan synthase subunit alpha [Hyphomicrobiales bacterium]